MKWGKKLGSGRGRGWLGEKKERIITILFLWTFIYIYMYVCKKYILKGGRVSG